LKLAAAGAGEIRGQVMGAGAPIANSTVTLWAADTPKQLAQTRTGADGSFALNASAAPGDATLYLVAKHLQEMSLLLRFGQEGEN
jgi:hypothetical protein